MTIEAAFFGTLGRDAESKVSRTGKPYVRLNVAVGTGDATQWVNVMTFDPEAIAAVDRMQKGCRVYCEGKLTLGEWTASDGSKRSGLSVMSFHCRPSHIGRNRPKRDMPASGRERAAASPYAPSGKSGFHNDEIGF